VPLFLPDRDGVVVVNRKDNTKTPAGLQIAGAAEATARLNGAGSRRDYLHASAQPPGPPRHFSMAMSEQADQTDRTARAMRDDVVRVAKGRPCHWVTVHGIAQRLGLDDEVSEAAVRRAIERGWFIADSDPPYSVRLSVVPTITA
jgi:hypothetical protein